MEQNIENKPQVKKKRIPYSTWVYIICLSSIFMQVFYILMLSGFYPTLSFNEQLFNVNKYEVWLCAMGIIVVILAIYYYRSFVGATKYLGLNSFFTDADFQNKLYNDNQKYISEGKSKVFLFFIKLSIVYLWFSQLFFLFKSYENDWLQFLVWLSLGITVTFSISFEIAGTHLIKDIRKKDISIKLKYSNKKANLQSIIKLINFELISGVGCIFYFVLSLFTVLSANTFFKVARIVTVFTSLFFLMMGILKISNSIKAYKALIKAFDNEKHKLLEELEKQDDISSMYLYDKLQEKEILSTKDKITLPIKVLISSTIMEYLRIKIVAPDDLNFIINYFLGIMG